MTTGVEILPSSTAKEMLRRSCTESTARITSRFAWFGKGAHHPYAVAHSNDEGRYRHHLENLYPFTKSIAIEWGAFADLSPESVAVWYQDSPEDTTVADGARSDSVEWDVFGPVPIPHNAQGKATVAPVLCAPVHRRSRCRQTVRVHACEGAFFQRLDEGLERWSHAEPDLYRPARNKNRL